MTDPGRSTTSPATSSGFRDAEAFLAELGVERRPIIVRSDQPDDPDTVTTTGAQTLREAAAPLVGSDGIDGAGSSTGAAPTPVHDGPPVSVTEAARIAVEAVPPDELATAIAYVRRSTSSQPSSEGRLRGRLRERGHDDDVVEAVLTQARGEGLVDDDAMSAALVAEWRAKGHAPRRIRDDLRRRGFDEDVIGRAVGELDQGDHAAMAFQLARRRAESLGDLPPETAFRRVAGYVARRGYGEGLARKAARDAVYDHRHDDRVAGH